MQDWTPRDKIAPVDIAGLYIDGLDNEGLDTDGPDNGGPIVTKLPRRRGRCRFCQKNQQLTGNDMS